ncbi:MAG TPA: AMP-binding protein [Gemmataceae bacterium]|nr:AMP-binding protein [Gemmataceae bacterium]
MARLILPLRYRVTCVGEIKWRDLPRPVLIMPNHPGYIDPAIMLTLLWPSLRPRPLLWEGMFLNPVLYPTLGLMRAVRIPDLSQGGAEARMRTEQAIAEVIAGLRRGENFLIWPAGHAERDGQEHLGGARAAADILRAVPGATVILARTRGVWGSSFSYAFTGHSPPLGRRLLQGAGLLLANLILFMPRRKVHITFERIRRDQLPELRRETLNPWLENWYNPDGPEKPTFVPYHFLFGPRTREFPPAASADEEDLSLIKPETKQAVANVLAEKLGRPLTDAEQQPSTTLDQLGLDSLDGMELTSTFAKRFGSSNGQVPENLGQLWAMAEGLTKSEPPKPPPPTWFQPLSSTGLVEPLGDSIIHGFVNRALAQRRDVIVGDDRAGHLTYERLLVGTLVLASRFARLPATNVGLLLPASIAADVSFTALLLAGKLPVILNWTTGPAHLAHAAQLMKLTHVITSRAFIDRTEIKVNGAQYLYLEDLRKEVGKLELTLTLLQVRFLPGKIRRLAPKIDPGQPAMVLFTSGSERAPKAVPLTHNNILSEMRAAVEFVGLTHEEVILGFLPPFHSFGIAACILLPLLGGMRVVHHADPTDAAGLAQKIATYRVTMLVGTPTFISYIFERSKPGDLDSLRLIVVGAEKCPASLYDRARKLAPKAELLEGYGVTECSPVVAVNRPGAARPGTVGQALPGVEVRAVELETEQTAPTGKTGMLWVSGPTVFPGYLGYDGPSPFREWQGKRWYVTGDLAEIDADGYIRLAGRLTRFLKAGGEMISLPALEEPFTRRYPPTEDGPRVAVEGIETESGRHIVLFTTESPSLQDANKLLQQEGFRGVMRLDEVRHVDRLPLLGTGKVDYKMLRAQLTDSNE